MKSFLWKCERECQVGNAHDAACRDSSISLCVCVTFNKTTTTTAVALLHCCCCCCCCCLSARLAGCLANANFIRNFAVCQANVSSVNMRSQWKAECRKESSMLPLLPLRMLPLLLLLLLLLSLLLPLALPLLWLNSSGIMHEYSCDFILLNETLCRAYKCQPIDSVCVCVSMCVSLPRCSRQRVGGSHSHCSLCSLCQRMCLDCAAQENFPAFA